MTSKFCLSGIIVLFSFSVSMAKILSYDSLGVTKKAGKNFIIHQVDKGETLFSLSRRYDVNVDEIMQENPESESGLKIGQKLMIPIARGQEDVKAKKGESVHVVAESETLYSIARQYDVTVDDLKKWNKLSDNNINIGDNLIIKKKPGVSSESSNTSRPNQTDYQGKKTHTVAESETLYSLSKQYNVSVSDIKKWNSLSQDDLYIGQVLIVGAQNTTPTTTGNSSMLPPSVDQNPTVDTTYSAKVNVSDIKTPEVAVGTTTDVDKALDSKKIVENGFAEVIGGSSETKKYLALHRSAPIGTIIQVRNDMNNQTVFVRVVGTIPSTGDNNKVLIKISKKAFDRLGSVDSRFPVEISYIP